MATLSATLSTAGAATDAFAVPAGGTATCTITETSFSGRAVLERAVGAGAWAPVNAARNGSVLPLDGGESYRVRLDSRTAGSVGVTFADSGYRELHRMVQMTQAEFDAISPDPNTLYVIVAA